ncbi:hypothetical protein CHARACLAT_033575 [Characodon lateralis]|uniref:Uncharacterized protein n=1 Tax=Characodon lateralis TaxID=208331 RepID=A0ABU7DLY7_9TELE|nr:hypothetical protein [Characodon lateralis]
MYPRSPATIELFNHLGDFSLGDVRVQPRVHSLCYHQGMSNGRFQEILPPADNVPRRVQQLPTSTVNSVGKALLPPPKAPDGLPESLRRCGTLGLTVPISSLRSPTSQPQPIGFFSMTASLTAGVHHHSTSLEPD